MQVYVDRKGRVKFETMVGTVLDPGNNQSYGYSDESEKYIHYRTAEEFRRSNFCQTMLKLNRTTCKDPWRKCGISKFLGLPVTKYVRTLQEGLNEEIYLTTALPMNYSWVREYVIASGGDCCPPGFPLKDVVISKKTAPQMVLLCIKLEVLKVPENFFSVPKGYELVTDDWQVYLGGAAESLIYMNNPKKSK